MPQNTNDSTTTNLAENYSRFSEDDIRHLIYSIRGVQVMLDRDLAVLYGVETKNLNKAVKRNLERFPDDFMFQLTKDEWELLKSQFVASNTLRFQNGTSNNDDNKMRFQDGTTKTGRGGVRYLPYAFTEHGVLTLAAVLRSDVAVAASIAITRTFVQMRRRIKQIADNHLQFEQLTNEIQNLRLEVNDILRDQNDINEDVRKQQDSITLQLESINDALAELQAEKNQKILNSQRNPIGFVKPNK